MELNNEEKTIVKTILNKADGEDIGEITTDTGFNDYLLHWLFLTASWEQIEYLIAEKTINDFPPSNYSLKKEIDQSLLLTYIHVEPKIKNMNKTEKRKLITLLFCKMVADKFPEYDIDEGEGGSLTLIPTWSEKTGDDSIDYHRSRYDLCWLNWASQRTKDDGLEMEKQLEQIIKQVDELPANTPYINKLILNQ